MEIEHENMEMENGNTKFWPSQNFKSDKFYISVISKWSYVHKLFFLFDLDVIIKQAAFFKFAKTSLCFSSGLNFHYLSVYQQRKTTVC